jgi:hypothetical protein
VISNVTGDLNHNLHRNADNRKSKAMPQSPYQPILLPMPRSPHRPMPGPPVSILCCSHRPSLCLSPCLAPKPSLSPFLFHPHPPTSFSRLFSPFPLHLASKLPISVRPCPPAFHALASNFFFLQLILFPSSLLTRHIFHGVLGGSIAFLYLVRF